MFERYTEKARRVIFFARYEASQFGSPYIETEHLLLGLLREDKALTNRFLRSHASVESIRKQIEAHTTIREKVSTSVDLPLSNECKRVLAYAAEEAHSHLAPKNHLQTPSAGRNPGFPRDQSAVDGSHRHLLQLLARSERKYRRSQNHIARQQPERHPQSRSDRGAPRNGNGAAGVRVIANAALHKHQAVTRGVQNPLQA